MALIDIVRTWPDHEQIKFFAAKLCRDKPNARYKKGLTPDEWFEQKFGQSIADYREEVRIKIQETEK